MSETIIRHHDTDSKAVLTGARVERADELQPGDVLLSRWAPGRFLTVLSTRTFCGYIDATVQPEEEGKRSSVVHFLPEADPFARRPAPADDGSLAAASAAYVGAGRTVDCHGRVVDLPDLPQLRKARPEAPRMVRRHFQFIAETIAELWLDDETSNTAYVAECFADALAGTNPRFDRERFLSAAGVAA